VDLDLLPGAQLDLVDDRRRGRDQVEIELALSRSWMISRCSRPRKPQRKPKPSAARGLHLVAEARVIEPQLAHRRAQVLELRGVDREQSAEHDRDGRTKAGQGSLTGLLSSVMVSPTRVSATSLIEAVRKPISPGPSSSS
jgi:hypothetical protein